MQIYMNDNVNKSIYSKLHMFFSAHFILYITRCWFAFVQVVNSIFWMESFATVYHGYIIWTPLHHFIPESH